jgi:DNA (cytosine-5)-methyltransferase 1
MMPNRRQPDLPASRREPPTGDNGDVPTEEPAIRARRLQEPPCGRTQRPRLLETTLGPHLMTSRRQKTPPPKERRQDGRSFTVAELFCGCGGFSHGFWRAGRFRTVLGNDIKKFALQTFRSNHSHDGVVAETIEDDIRRVSDNAIAALLRSRGVDELDCLIGGPPCQGFSQMRRTEGRRGSKIVRFGGYNKLDQDPRNDLVLRFLEVAAALNPKVVVIENVPQFLSHYHDGKRGGIAQQVEEVLDELGYSATSSVLNAADYGVPQLRQRAVIIASRLGKIALPTATHGERADLIGRSGKQWVTVSEAIGDLPPDPPLRDTLVGQSDAYGTEGLSAFAKQMRTSGAFPANHITRSYQKRIVDIISQMRPGETWDDASARMQRRFAALIEKAVARGERESVARARLVAEERILPAFYKSYYWSAYTRLAPDRPALTITANANFLGSGRFTHPERHRGITMREAARLQSFDDAFTFVTSDKPGRETENIGVGLDMIGEAVPPLLAQAIAEAVKLHLDEKEG